MPLQQTSGNVTADAYGGGVAVEPVYIESIFSTWLYTGTGAAQTVTNGIDLSTKGGLVWVKDRSQGYSHGLVDTARGISSGLSTDTTGAAGGSAGFTSFDTTGFSFGSAFGVRNNSGDNYASWTFREQPKFFDIVTYTGDSTNGRAIPHSLGSTPGCFIIKCTSNAGLDWIVYHSALGVNSNVYLNDTTGAVTGNNFYNGIAPTSTNIYVGSSAPGSNAYVNQSGRTYVAYLFAHNAGGFGLTGTDNVISCGSFTLDGSNTAIVTLGYEPQWVLVKRTNAAANWAILDNMRGLTTSGVDAALRPNTSSAETNGQEGIYPTATGFGANTGLSSAGDTYIYIAIRRGPMKVPTLGTSVFSPIARTGTGAVAQITGVGFPPDLAINADRTRSASANTQVTDRLRGTSVSVFTNRTDGDLTYTNAITAFGSDGETLGTDATQGAVNVSGNTYINWLFGRAPGFFDEVCYTGTGGASNTITHNLGVVPEMIILKKRSGVSDWPVYHTGVPTPLVNNPILNGTAASYANSYITPTPTTTQFVVNGFNDNTGTYVAYLFATCPGVSKVGSYTGNGTTQTINCGFTGGARFVLIKRTDASGDWYTYDTARGMTTLTDPYLLLNSTAAETATLGSVTTVSTGFALNSTILAAINVSAGTYIFLAIA